VKLSAYKP